MRRAALRRPAVRERGTPFARLMLATLVLGTAGAASLSSASGAAGRDARDPSGALPAAGIRALRSGAPGRPREESCADFVNPLSRAHVKFDDRGVLVHPAEVDTSSGNVSRTLRINTTTGVLTEEPISE